MTKSLFNAVNSDNIETIEVFDKIKEKNWEYTDTFKWKTSFLNKDKKLKVPLKWYNIGDFESLSEIISDKKSIIKNIKQFVDGDDLLKYLGNIEHQEGSNKYFIIDDTLYIKPRIKITFVSGQSKFIYFNNPTRAVEYVSELKAKIEVSHIIYI